MVKHKQFVVITRHMGKGYYGYHLL